MRADATDVTALDAAVDRMRRHIPAQPYIQVIPQDEPSFRHYNRYSADAWLNHTPFHPSESPSIQYQTWFYREHGSDTIHLRLNDSPEQESLTPRPTNPQPHANALSTKEPTADSEAQHPRVLAMTAPAKKKISLAAYKKSASSHGTPLAASRDRPSSTPNDKPTASPMSTKPAALDTLKRKLGPNDADGAVKRQRSLTPLDTTTPPGRHELLLPDRLSPLSRIGTAHSRSASNTSGKVDGLPQRLSPLKIPASKHEHGPEDTLSGRMSPLEAAHTRSDHHHLPTVKNKEHALDHSPLPTSLPSPLSPTLPSVIIRGLKQRAAQRDQAAKQDRSPAKQSDVTSSSAQFTKIVKLKIPKRMRIDFRRLLQFPPKPSFPRSASKTSAEAHSAIDSSQRSQTTFSSDSPFDPTGARTAAKKPAANSAGLAGPAEGVCIPSGNHSRNETAHKSDQLITPPPGTNNSPQKLSRSSPSTGRRDGRGMTAVAMVRGESTEGAANAATPDSPAVSDLSHGLRPSPRIGSIGSAKTAESQAWWLEREKFIELAKTLKKRHATAHADRATSLKPSRPGESRREAEFAALTNIESLAAFMLSFHCHDTSYAHRSPTVSFPSPKGTWCTLHGFWRFVYGVCAPWPTLHALVCALGQSYNARIMNALTYGGSSTCPVPTSSSTSAAVVGTLGPGPVRGVVGGGGGGGGGGTEEYESMSAFAKTLTGPSLDLTVLRRLAQLYPASATLGVQGSVLDAVWTAVVLLDEYVSAGLGAGDTSAFCVAAGSASAPAPAPGPASARAEVSMAEGEEGTGFRARLKRAMEATSLLALSTSELRQRRQRQRDGQSGFPGSQARSQGRT